MANSKEIESKVLEKIKDVLAADTGIVEYVGTTIYTNHPSTIKNPELPAISLLLMDGIARVNVPGVVDMTIQIDLWFPFDRYTIQDVLSCCAIIRGLLHREVFKDATIDIQISQLLETSTGPLMFDEEINSHHYPVRYSIVAI